MLRFFKENQTGRSMVEMLGVLAIIGVLSAGALSGYSKAMKKHKMNQLIQDYETVMQGLYQYRRGLEEMHTTEGNVNIVSYMQSLNLLPPTWTIVGNDFFDNFKNKTYIEIGQTYGRISFHTVFSAGQNEMCQNMVWELIKPNSQILYYVRNNENIHWYGDFSGYSSSLLKNMTMGDALTLCAPCKDAECEIVWLMQ